MNEIEEIANIRTLIGVLDGALHQLMLEELARVSVLPQAIGEIIISGDGVLPGCFSRIIEKPDHSEISGLLATLEREAVLERQSIVHWLEANGQKYPATSAYIICLDSIRRLAIDFLKRQSI